MAAYTSTKTGNWSDSTVWGGTPTSADTCTIANTHTVTLDTTGCTCLSLTVNSGGALSSSGAANISLWVYNGIAVNSGGTVSIDHSSDATKTCDILINYADSATAYVFQITGSAAATIKGATRKRITTLTAGISAGATSATVADATGWRVGDTVAFATTQAYNATTRTDVVTLTSVSGGTIGWTGGITYDHASGGYVGNFSSNVKFGPKTANKPASLWYSDSYTGSYGVKLIQDVLFTGCADTTYNHYGAFSFGSGAASTSDCKLTLNNCAFYQNYKAGVCQYGGTGRNPAISNCVFFSTVNTASSDTQSSSIISDSTNSHGFAISGCGVFANAGSANGHSAAGIRTNLTAYAPSITNTFVSGCVASYGIIAAAPSSTIENVEVFSCSRGILLDNGSLTASSLDNGVSFGATHGTADYHGSIINAVLADCQTQTLSNTSLASAINAHSVSYINKNADVTLQEIYRPFCSIKRDNSNTNRATSSIAIQPTVVSTNATRTLTIPCANGASVRIVGYVKKSHATNISAFVSLSGLGTAWGGFTSANNTDWQQFDTGTITNSSGSDGNLTLTYTANSSSGTTNTVYFDGVPDAPFVTKCRHYGFLFDESSPTRTTDPYAVASEATAAAYTGVTINGGTKRITFGAGTADTAQKFYDYSRAWCCTNLAQQVPFTRAGALLALASGWTTVDPAYSGVTWGGGNVEFTAAGNKSGAFDTCDMTFTAAGTYNFSSATFGGTVELINTSGGSVTVELPAGVSYTNTGPNITVTTPQVYQSVTLAGVAAGSRVQIYDTTNGVELLNSTAAATWTDGTPAAGNRAIRIRVSKVSGATAKEFIEANIGTCGTTEPSNALTYLVSQSDDAVYNANGINGSTVTGITFTDSATDLVNVDVASNAVTWPQIYAAFVYWMSTASGIADDIAYIEAKDTANYTLTSMKIKNTSSPMEPLVVSGGYGVDSSTGTSLPLVDTTGGTLIFAPDHVVSYAVGSGVTASDKTDIAAAVLAAASSAPISADIKRVSGTTVAGSGTTVDPWNPA